MWNRDYNALPVPTDLLSNRRGARTTLPPLALVMFPNPKDHRYDACYPDHHFRDGDYRSCICVHVYSSWESGSAFRLRATTSRLQPSAVNGHIWLIRRSIDDNRLKMMLNSLLGLGLCSIVLGIRLVIT
jgi:hypothetical protein